MSDTTIRIIIVTQGAKAGADAFKNIGTSAASASASINSFNVGQGAAFGSAAAAAIKRVASIILEVADDYILFSNRIRLATENQGQANYVMQKLFEIGNQTRTSFESLGETYDKLAQSSTELGLTTSDLLDLTLTLSEAFTAEGASSSAIAATINQISVAFAQGSLTGRQFRTIIGNQPFLVDQLSKALGVSTEKLRQLGAQGKLSSEQLIAGFTIAAPEIEKQFQIIQATLSGRLTVLKNQVVEGGAKIVNSSVVSGFLASAVGVVTARIDDVAELVAVFTDKGRATDELLEQTRQEAIRATKAKAELAKYIRETSIPSRATATQSEFQENQSYTLKKSLDLQVLLNKEGSVAASVQISVNERMAKGLITESEQNRLLKEKRNLTDIYNEALSKGLVTQAEQNDLASGKLTIDELSKTVLERQGFSEEAINKLLKERVTFLDLNNRGYTKISDSKASELSSAARSLALEKVKSSIIAETGGNQEDFNTKLRVAEGLLGEANKGTEGWKDKVGVLIEYIEKLKVKNADLFPDAAHALISGQEQVKSLTKDNRGIAAAYVNAWKEANGPAKAYQETVLGITAALKDNQINQEQANRQLLEARVNFLETQTTLEAGFERGFDKITLEVTNFSTLAEQSVTDAFHGMEDALVNFVKTGKLDFSSLVDSILTDMIKILLRATIEAPILAVLNALTGGLLGGAAGAGTGGYAAFLGGSASIGAITPARAAGGPVSGGSPYMVGERGPELFVPGNSGHIIPNGGSSGTTINVHNIVDRDSIIGVLNDPKAHDTIVNVIAVNRKSIKSILAS